MKQTPYLYIITRGDLSKAQQAVQAAHAAAEFVSRNGFKEHPHFVITKLRDEHDLQSFHGTIDKSIGSIIWREPDRNNEITAIAYGIIYGENRKLFQDLSLI